MTQAELNRAVARATGESISEIARRGFSPLEPLADERAPLVVDWDETQAERRVAVFQQRSREKFA
jgi:hypothetical protein